ncbi:hypothetical protein B0J18DRAFT_172771 [Chaetomium sp. MPI-SDFR-AT-0129]|nr:hypothetical protein B0J18DRAFT_172771 [Chaetomium sp. MPI-SDFR-AT-0129]
MSVICFVQEVSKPKPFRGQSWEGKKQNGSDKSDRETTTVSHTSGREDCWNGLGLSFWGGRSNRKANVYTPPARLALHYPPCLDNLDGLQPSQLSKGMDQETNNKLLRLPTAPAGGPHRLPRAARHIMLHRPELLCLLDVCFAHRISTSFRTKPRTRHAGPSCHGVQMPSLMQPTRGVAVCRDPWARLAQHCIAFATDRRQHGSFVPLRSPRSGPSRGPEGTGIRWLGSLSVARDG